jgi:hypothetical protein
MKPLTSGIIVLASAGLLLLGACSKEAKTSDSASTNSATPTAETAPPATVTKTIASGEHSEKSPMNPKKGGQVVESGKYHLELVPEKEGGGTHLDFYLLRGDTHESVPTAKVTADIQSPDGKQKTIPLSYDASGKHYAAALAEKATGQYQVKITATIGSEKIDGRFNLNQ